MMRLPLFRYVAPRSIEEAAEILGRDPKETMVLAGGTDLLPNMKRRQQVPKTLLALRNVAALKAITNGNGLTLGSDRKSTRLNSSHLGISYAVFCLKKK